MISSRFRSGSLRQSVRTLSVTPERPRVSVIIASFQWPEALRISLAGALAQTVEDLEVLVVEDGPDRASRAVVRESKDDRVRWMCLPQSTGSQAGPNTYGLRAARAPIVAYLGHDDIWHPEHLADLLEVLVPPVDVAHAVTLFLGADQDDRLEIAGTHAWQETTFVPPSSIAHRRESPRVGAWTGPEGSGMPVDYAFLVSANARGARFATSAEPTVFKFPAAWRLDSYRTRDVSPQLQLRQRLISEPQVGRHLVRDALAAGVPGEIPAPPRAAPGVIADYNRRLKGLPARFSPPLTRWTPSNFLVFPGWHPAERDETGSFAWTGPGGRAFVRLDAPGDGELGVQVVVRHVLSREQLDRLVVDLDGTVVELARSEGSHGATVLTGWLARGPRAHTIEVGLSTAPALASVCDPESRDERLLGAAVSEIQLLDRPARGGRGKQP
jgi:hypothetical protein